MCIEQTDNSAREVVSYYVHNSLYSLPCSAFNNLEISDSTWCANNLNNSDIFLLGLIYQSPNSSLSNAEKLIQVLPNLQQLQRHTHLLLMGDFNFPNIDWCSHTVNARSFNFLSKDSFLFLYRTCIRSHLEYCAPSWSPYLAKDIDALEWVQHCATKLVKSLFTLPYEDRLVSLQLQSLYCCRQHGDLIETFKILNDFTNVQIGTTFTLSTIQLTRDHPFKLSKNRFNLELRRHYFMWQDLRKAGFHTHL